MGSDENDQFMDLSKSLEKKWFLGGNAFSFTFMEFSDDLQSWPLLL